MIFDENDLAGAVFIFSEDRELMRELNYSEFEALLDGYVPSMELANRELYGMYVEINSRYLIEAAVCFWVRFSSEGFIDQPISVPLFKLALHAQKGPNLGAGNIKLATAKQCPIKGLDAALWNPDLKNYREFKKVMDAIKRNRMSIQFKVSDSDKVIEDKSAVKDDIQRAEEAKRQKKIEQALRDQFVEKIREQRAKNAEALREREQSLASLKQQHVDRMAKFQRSLDQHKAHLDEAHKRNSELQELVDGQAEKIKGLREYFEHKLEQAASSPQENVEELKQTHQMELDSAVEVATRELKELLEIREVEILYRNEQETKLHEEIELMKEEIARLKDTSGEKLLTRMLESGISFMTYQPGTGHISLPLSEIPNYMENAVAYVAKQCGVTEAHYNAWLEHYHVPVCRDLDSEGNMCGEDIDRVESPTEFTAGESDCCFKHRKKNAAPHLKVAGGNES